LAAFVEEVAHIVGYLGVIVYANQAAYVCSEDAADEDEQPKSYADTHDVGVGQHGKVIDINP
jgi:hypothetical protein